MPACVRVCVRVCVCVLGGGGGAIANVEGYSSLDSDSLQVLSVEKILVPNIQN